MRRNIFFIIIIFMVSLFLFGCEEITDSYYSVWELKQYVIDSIHAYEGEENEAGEQVYYIIIANDLKLPTENPDVKGTKITWTSLDEACIDNSGTIIERDSRKILNIDFECKVEYGKDTLELPKLVNTTYKGKKFYLLDDIYATGNTAKAIEDAIKSLKGNVVGTGVVLNIKELNDNKELFSIIDINEE